jgi:AraC-like DNA-binding protein
VNRQSFFPKIRDITPENTCVIRELGLDRPEGTFSRHGRDWFRHQACRQDYFVLNSLESYSTAEWVGYTRQEDYVKINFWLGGRHTTVLNGFGEHQHDRPEVFITSGPVDMVKVDLHSSDAHIASVALCLLPQFFQAHMDLDTEELPAPLAALFASPAPKFCFYRYALTADVAAATRAILAAPFEVRRQPMYLQAKAVELMCLLINRLGSEQSKHASAEPRSPKHWRLYEARELICRNYAQPITLARLSREIGMNRVALTNGFRELFGMSVHDYLQQIRMERAYELLHTRDYSVAQVADAVGYRHCCNFTTAFRAYFGCKPKSVGTQRAEVGS